MRDVRVGLIGLGAFGETHLRAPHGIPGVIVQAVASRSFARARTEHRFQIEHYLSNVALLTACATVMALRLSGRM